MSKATFFISDLHLSAQRPEIIQLFLHFLRHHATQAESLYILGDLFDSWIGDDHENKAYTEIETAIFELVETGTHVFIMHGNRDFLIDKQFEEKTLARLILDPTIVILNRKKVLLMHGDTLCLDDVEYLEFRKMVRDHDWKKGFLSMSIIQREALANSYRQTSKEKTQLKEPEIMDVAQRAVKQVMKKSRSEVLIHGHTHRPNTHHFTVKGKTHSRIVLADWYQQGSVLIHQNGEFHTETITLPKNKPLHN